jgi:hypothetical protein
MSTGSSPSGRSACVAPGGADAATADAGGATGATPPSGTGSGALPAATSCRLNRPCSVITRRE